MLYNVHHMLIKLPPLIDEGKLVIESELRSFNFNFILFTILHFNKYVSKVFISKHIYDTTWESFRSCEEDII